MRSPRPTRRGLLSAVSLDTEEPHHWYEVLAGEGDRPEAVVDFELSALSVDGLFPLWVLHRGPEVFGDVGILDLDCDVVVQDTEEVNREACGRTGVGGPVYHVIVD